MFIIVAVAPLNKRCSQHYGIIFVHECENRTLVQSHQFVAKLHQNAPNRVLNFKKGVDTPGPPYTGVSAPRPPGRGNGGKGEGGSYGKGRGEGRGRRKVEGRRSDNIHLLLPQAHSHTLTQLLLPPM